MRRRAAIIHTLCCSAYHLWSYHKLSRSLPQILYIIMPGSRLFKDLLKRRKKGNEAPRGGPASVTTTKTPEQDGSSTVIRGGTSISTAERTQVGNAIPAADSQEAAVRPPANGTPEAESKGMKICETSGIRESRLTKYYQRNSECSTSQRNCLLKSRQLT